MSPDAKRLALAIIIASSLLFSPTETEAQSAFYQAPDAEIAGAPGTIIRQEAMLGSSRRRVGLSRAVPIDGTGRQTHRGLRRHYSSRGYAPCEWLADRRLGSPDDGNCPALRTLACDFHLSADRRQPGVARARLRDRGDRLSRAGNRGAASLSRRRERGTRRDRFGAGGAIVPGHGQFQSLRGVGTFARRTSLALHRHDFENLRAGAGACRCRSRGSRDRPRNLDDR